MLSRYTRTVDHRLLLPRSGLSISVPAITRAMVAVRDEPVHRGYGRPTQCHGEHGHVPMPRSQRDRPAEQCTPRSPGGRLYAGPATSCVGESDESGKGYGEHDGRPLSSTPFVTEVGLRNSRPMSNISSSKGKCSAVAREEGSLTTAVGPGVT
ncbi:hypothetical protein DCS_07238 [Drechmeria coniospora]|uniref:Uncharacterized protein n=1 Tax=Drechmeria coniospora TaxID=98403 RepID=A0A151GDW6_DRECN|nr:hypothetical protein DCS_07238 [Drechmeria coniospora]KYK55275.1 hypothetical protein DCS_07238 [Drechmeria coniospora]